MQANPRYGDLVEEVVGHLAESASRAERAGIPRERLLVDPGIGFGKTAGHNLFLLQRVGDLRVLGLPVLVGTSRKSFLGGLTGKPPAERVVSTAATVAVIAAAGGADFVRVHDVAEAKDAAAVGDAVRKASTAGDLFPSSGEVGSP
jgi:dihydropteroate synthase